MKKFLSLRAVALFFFVLTFTLNNATNATADDLCGLSHIEVASLQNGQSVTFKDPPANTVDKTSYAGTIHTVMDGNPAPVYCVDLHRTVSLGDNTYTDTCAYVVSKIQYILDHYFPFAIYPMVDINAEAAAIQIAIWHYTDGVDANTVTDVGIRNRALVIIADADINGLSSMPIVTFFILPGTGPEYFYIKTLDQNGDPIQVNNISLFLSDTNGVLSDDTVNTNSSGISPEVEVIGTSSGTITAIARMLFPQGRIIHAQTGDRQSLAIAYPVYGKMGIVIDWGALPVELSSFNSYITTSDVTLNWTTTTEVNNYAFEIERSEESNPAWTTIAVVSGHGTTNSPEQYSYSDRGLNTGTYNYRLKQIDFNGNFEYHNLSNEVVIGTPTTFKLSQNYPNPFNPETKISYTNPTNGLVTLKIFDISGKEIATLVNQQMTAGYYTVNFNASALSSGAYYYKLQIISPTESFMQTKKMILTK